MKPSELTELMHTVLDGEATQAEARVLERHLAADPEARAEYDSLRALFDELKGMPQAFPPEGMVASIMADLPSPQLSPPSRVISQTAQAFQRNIANDPISDTARRASRSVLFSGSERMNEQKSGIRGKHKVIWVGGALAALAVILVATSGIDFPPGGTTTSGAIVPAQRFRAEQPATTAVSAPGQSQSAQGDARSSDARASDSLKTDGHADSLSNDRLNARQDGRADGLSDGRISARQDGRADGLSNDRISNDRINARQDGRADGLSDGRVSARQDGRADGLSNDRISNDRINARQDGRADGLSDGRVSARQDGRADGLSDGRVNDGRTMDGRAVDGRVSNAHANDGRVSQ